MVDGMAVDRDISRQLERALLTIALVCGVSVCAPLGVAFGDEATARYCEQLRQRRLFSLAEGYCLSRLEEGELTRGRRTLLTIELSRTFSEHARYTSGREQSELWRRSAEVIGRLVADDPDNPRRPLLEVQRALVSAGKGEHLRWQAELFPYDAELPQRAAAALDDSVSRLRKLEERLAEDSGRKTPRTSEEADGLSSYELRALWYHARNRIGWALIERSRLDPAGSPDRIGRLLDAESWLGPLAKVTPDERLTLNSRLLLAEANRLRGDRKRAAEILNSVEAEEPARDLRDRMTAARARLLLDVDRPTDAARLLSEYRTERRRLPGELRFLQIESLTRLWEIADRNEKPELAAELMEQVVAYAERAESEVGGFWGYRCRLLLESAKESERYGGELAAVVRKARLLYAAGQTDKAVDEYSRAFDAAVRAGKRDIAVELGYTRASVRLESKNYREAAALFHELAQQFPSSRQAGSAHLLWAYCLGRLYDEERTRSRRERYTEALVEHRAKFSDSPTAVEATWMLALLEEQRLQVTRALTLYREIPADHPRGPSAQLAVARCYEKILDRLHELGRPVDSWEQEAIARLGEITAGFPEDDEPLRIEQAETCLRFARILLNRKLPDYSRAGQLLDRVESTRKSAPTAASPDDSPRVASRGKKTRWNLLYRAATQLRIVALAGRGSFQEAESLVENLSETNSEAVLSILDGLSELTAHAEPTTPGTVSTRRRLGELQLQTALELNRRRAELEPAQQRQLDNCLAQAYLATGQSAKAVEVYETLLARSPKDRRLLKTVAELLTDCGTPQCFRSAKGHWRRLESLEEAGSAEWMNARYHVALCAWSLKEYDECRKLLAVTRLVYPQLGGEELRSRFAALEQQLMRR